MDLKQHYRSYIARINAGCETDALAPYVHDGIVHNDSAPMSVDEYAQLIRDSQRDLPGLHFADDLLVVEHDDAEDAQAGDGTVAVRIKLSYTPNPTAGGQEVFHEHVFYSFKAGKIARVWSLLDGAGLKWKENRPIKGQS